MSLFETCEKHGVDVFEAMVLLVTTEPDPEKKFMRLQTIAQYLYPKRKAVEVTGDDKGFQVIIKDYSK